MALTIAITGATGFVGGHLLEALQGRGHRVRALCRDPKALASRDLPDLNLEIVKGDLASHDTTAFLKDADVLLHMAGAIKALDRETFLAVNAEGTARLATAAAQLPKPPRMLLLSSLAARAPQLSDYAGSKRAGEVALRAIGKELSWQILRAPAVYGPGDRATLDVFKQFKHGLCLVPGSGQGRFSLICVTDLAAALVAMMERPGPDSATYEIDDGAVQGHDWVALAAAGAKAFDRPVRRFRVPGGLLFALAFLPLLFAKVSGKAQVFTPGKVCELCHPDWVAKGPALPAAVDWQPRVTLEEGFAKTVAWYNAQGWL